MAVVQNKKMDKTISNLLSRQNYLVTQANDLARSFGNLTTFEHKVLDYCFSFVKAEDTSDQTYTVQMIDIIRHLGLNSSGKNYQRVGEAFRALNTKTAIYLRTYKNGMNGILMTSLFDYIEIVEDGKTFAENSLIKASVPAKLGYIGVADDSGLEVDALNGAPGVYSARYSGEGATDEKNKDRKSVV